MKRLIFLLLLISALNAQQYWKEPNAIWNDWGHYVSSTDSVYYQGGYITIQGNDTLIVFIPMTGTWGLMSIWGYVTNLSGAGSDAVKFEMAPHRGDGQYLDSNFSATYQTLSSLTIAAGGTEQFDLYPMANSTLNDEYANFFNLRITGSDNHRRRIYLKVEWDEPK